MTKSKSGKAKKFLLLLLSAVLFFTLLPVTAHAADTTICLDYLKDGASGTGYSYDSGVLTISGPGPFLIRSDSNTGKSIKVATGITTDITLQNLINQADTPLVIEGATVNLMLTYNNTLTGSTGPAIRVTSGGSLTITGTGTLTAAGSSGYAGISCDSGSSVTINGGSVTAQGGANGAGIGGNSGGSGGAITVNGGNVTATGGGNGAGIGGGNSGSSGVITINGGTVTATGGENGAGIGGGNLGSGGTVVIDGSNIIASGGTNGENIGKGAGGTSSGTLKNSDGYNVYLTTVTFDGITEKTEVSALTTNAGYTYGTNGTMTDAAGKFYIYLPNGTNITGAATSAGRSFTGLVTTNIDPPVSLGTLYPNDFTVTGDPAGYTYNGGVLTFITSGAYTVSMAGMEQTDDNRIVVNASGSSAANPVNITIDGIKIDRSADTVDGCAFKITGSHVNLTLAGDNVLNSGSAESGILVSTGAVLAIGGTGTVKAAGGANGAGIGGGSGIGGGEITINGGTVTAQGGENGAGIGGGNLGSGGTVVIDGGSVIATGGTNGENIGKGAGGTSGGTLKNSAGADVYLTTVTLDGLSEEAGIGSLTTDLTYTYGASGIMTDAAGKIHIYLPDGTGTTEAVTLSSRSFTGLVTTVTNAAASHGTLYSADFVVTGDAAGYTYDKGVLTFTTSGDYSVAMTTTEPTTNRIVLDASDSTADNPVNITISSINIDHSGKVVDGGAFECISGSVANLTLVGENVLKSGTCCYVGSYYGNAGLRVANTKLGHKTASLTINGPGSLKAYGGSAGAGEPYTVGGAGIGSSGQDCLPFGSYGAGSFGMNNTLTINGGTIEAYGAEAKSINGSATIKYIGGNAGIGFNQQSSVYINGGTVTAKGGRGYAGIACYNSSSVTINDGDVTATGGGNYAQECGAGIGGSYYLCHSGGSMTINGGTVHAENRGNAAGIGGGGGNYGREYSSSEDAGTITINGGDVTACSGWSPSLEYTGAAIGGGGSFIGEGACTANRSGGGGGTITITGGTVYAKANGIGACIGGGGIGVFNGYDGVYTGGSGGNITISGGTVTAFAASYNIYNSACIGGGCAALSSANSDSIYAGDGGVITISGGTVNAIQNGYLCTCIGGGSVSVLAPYGSPVAYEGDGGAVTISGGSVKCTLREGGTLIGSGGGKSNYTLVNGDPGTLRNTSGEDVYLTTVALDGVTAETGISAMTTDPDLSYGTKDVYTDAGGKLYLYLPSGAKTTASQTTDGAATPLLTAYTGSVETTSDGLGSGILYRETVGASISPATGSFDIYQPDDVTSTITWNDASSVTGIKVSGTSIGTDSYSVSGSALTIKKAYLEKQAPGSLTLTISFDKGASATLTITVTDTTPPTISPGFVTYDLNSPGDVSAAINWHSATTAAGATYNLAALTAGTDYAVSGNTLTIKNSFLSSKNFSAGSTAEFEFTFDTGDTATLMVNVVNDYTRGSDATLKSITVGGSPVSLTSGKYSYDVVLPYGTQPGSAAAMINAVANDTKASVEIVQASSVPGSATITVTAEDKTTSDYTVSFTSDTAPDSAPVVTTTSLPSGTVNTAYSQALTSTGDTPITWAKISGDLPGGLSLSDGGVISGVPLATGTFNFTVEATNAAGSDTQSLSLTITNTASYTITVSAGSGGSISPSGSVSVTSGGSQTFSITPNNNYSISSVTVDSVNQGTIASYTFSNVSGNHTISATFTYTGGSSDGSSSGGGISAAKYTVSADTSPNGTVTLYATSVNKGGSATITISPKEGYRITDVLINGVSVGAVSSYTIKNISKNIIVKAVFEKIEDNTEDDPDAWVNPYSDVSNDEWYYDSVRYVSQKGLMYGTSTDTFNPNGHMTRAMAVTVLFRLGGETGSNTNTFSDVSAGAWYEQAVAWAAANGIASGVGENSFAPENELSREQLAVMLYNFAKYKGLDVMVTGSDALNSYTDAKSVSSWAKDAMNWAVSLGIISGDGVNLDPQGNATRAQIAAILQRFIESALSD